MYLASLCNASLRPANWASRRLALRLELELADEVDHGPHAVHRCLRQNAMAQIEDMARARPGALQNLMNSHFQLGQRREQNRWIQIALHSGAIADVHPSLVDVDAPIHAHHVATSGVQLAEEARRAGTEVNHRDAGGANAFDQSARIRRYVAHVVVRA